MDANEIFNAELLRQIQGTLPKGHIYRLGRPCEVLLKTGFPDLPIELSSTRLEEKSKQNNRPYELDAVMNLVSALQDPLAVFAYGDREKSQNVIVELNTGDKHFVVGILDISREGFISGQKENPDPDKPTANKSR